VEKEEFNMHDKLENTVLKTLREEFPEINFIKEVRFSQNQASCYIFCSSPDAARDLEKKMQEANCDCFGRGQRGASVLIGAEGMERFKAEFFPSSSENYLNSL
jgi:hypothetical protein